MHGSCRADSMVTVCDSCGSAKQAACMLSALSLCLRFQLSHAHSCMQCCMHLVYAAVLLKDLTRPQQWTFLRRSRRRSRSGVRLAALRGRVRTQRLQRAAAARTGDGEAEAHPLSVALAAWKKSKKVAPKECQKAKEINKGKEPQFPGQQWNIALTNHGGERRRAGDLYLNDMYTIPAWVIM